MNTIAIVERWRQAKIEYRRQAESFDGTQAKAWLAERSAKLEELIREIRECETLLLNAKGEQTMSEQNTFTFEVSNAEAMANIVRDHHVIEAKRLHCEEGQDAWRLTIATRLHEVYREGDQIEAIGVQPDLVGLAETSRDAIERFIAAIESVAFGRRTFGDFILAVERLAESAERIANQ